MNLVNYETNPNNQNESFLNMDLIESISKKDGNYKVWMIGDPEREYDISESAYNTILLYGKAKIQ